MEHKRLYLVYGNYFVQGNGYGNINAYGLKIATEVFLFLTHRGKK